MEMKSRVRGQELLPGERGYDAERKGWNLIVEHRPAMVQATGHDPSAPPTRPFS
jgi:hypothetical protein